MLLIPARREGEVNVRKVGQGLGKRESCLKLIILLPWVRDVHNVDKTVRCCSTLRNGAQSARCWSKRRTGPPVPS